MALLQAARARHLGLSEESARSWGLNRAIFYAAAKRGFRGSGSVTGRGESSDATPGIPNEVRFALADGDDVAYRNPASRELYFRIGGKDQTEQDFDHQISSRFGDAAKFREAWREASQIIATFSDDTLRSRTEFYSKVYKPQRDALVADWSARFGPKTQTTPSATVGRSAPGRSKRASRSADVSRTPRA